MEWLDELTEERRRQSPTYNEAERRIEALGGGYEVELVTDGFGNPLSSPELIAAGDANGIYHLD